MEWVIFYWLHVILNLKSIFFSDIINLKTFFFSLPRLFAFVYGLRLTFKIFIQKCLILSYLLKIWHVRLHQYFDLYDTRMWYLQPEYSVRINLLWHVFNWNFCHSFTQNAPIFTVTKLYWCVLTPMSCTSMHVCVIYSSFTAGSYYKINFPTKLTLMKE